MDHLRLAEECQFIPSKIIGLLLISRPVRSANLSNLKVSSLDGAWACARRRNGRLASRVISPEKILDCEHTNSFVFFLPLTALNLC